MIDLPMAAPNTGDPLSQPTRARLFALLSELAKPVATAELAKALGLHPNGIRLHLEQLEQAGLIERTRVRHRRGRPADAWNIAPGAEPAGQPPRAYNDLGRWLARALGTQPAQLAAAQRTGRQIGRELAPSGAGAPDEALRTSLASLGFQPSLTKSTPDQVSVRLGNCPYRDAARENQPAICALHEGLTRGLLDVLAPGAQVAAFVPHDPDRAGCEIEVGGLANPAG